MPAVTTPMMTTTTMISISVKPAAHAPVRRRRPAHTARLVADVPVADLGITALTPGRAVAAEGVHVVLLAVRARICVLIVVAPGVLADPLQVAARLPVLDRRIGRLGQQGRQGLLR